MVKTKSYKRNNRAKQRDVQNTASHFFGILSIANCIKHAQLIETNKNGNDVKGDEWYPCPWAPSCPCPPCTSAVLFAMLYHKIKVQLPVGAD